MNPLSKYNEKPSWLFPIANLIVTGILGKHLPAVVYFES